MKKIFREEPKVTVISRLIRKIISRGIEDSILSHVPDLNLSNFEGQELIQLKNRVLAEQKMGRNRNKNTGNIFR